MTSVAKLNWSGAASASEFALCIGNRNIKMRVQSKGNSAALEAGAVWQI